MFKNCWNYHALDSLNSNFDSLDSKPDSWHFSLIPRRVSFDFILIICPFRVSHRNRSWMHVISDVLLLHSLSLCFFPSRANRHTGNANIGIALIAERMDDISKAYASFRVKKKHCVHFLLLKNARHGTVRETRVHRCLHILRFDTAKNTHHFSSIVLLFPLFL